MAPSFGMKSTCGECPWRVDVPVGKFPASRYRALEPTCQTGGLHPVFACHMSPDGKEVACAGFLIVHGLDNNLCRVFARDGGWTPGSVEASAPLFASFNELAKANGYDPETGRCDNRFHRAYRRGRRELPEGFPTFDAGRSPYLVGTGKAATVRRD